MQHAMAKPSSACSGASGRDVTGKDGTTTSAVVEPTSSSSQLQPSNSASNVLSHLQTSFMTDNSDSDDDEVSEVRQVDP